MCDDEGYFRADPAIVRGEVMPFRENLARIRECIEKLSEVGFIEVSRHPEQGEIGRVAKWAEHQKVDHPRASKIKVYFSREIIAKVRDVVALEGEGNGNREVEGEAIPEDLHATQYATRLLQEIGYPEAKQNVVAVASAIDAEVKLGRSKPAAYEYVLGCTRDLIDQGAPITTFTFTEAKYRPEIRRNGNGANTKVRGVSAGAQRDEQNIDSLVAAARNHAAKRDANHSIKRESDFERGSERRVAKGVV